MAYVISARTYSSLEHLHKTSVISYSYRMPELPECETIKNQLNQALPLVVDAVTYSKVSSSIIKPGTQLFDPTGMTLNQIDRHGKMLIFKFLDSHGVDFYLLSHLGMSGTWRISNGPLEDIPHVHVVLHGVGKTFSYVDPRRFGKMYFCTKEVAKARYTRLGIDIASDEFTTEYIYQTLKKYPQRQLKPFLLDQAYFAGSGNYIACEICARAGIRPTRRCGKISKKEAEKILAATKSILNDTLTTGGMTFSGGYQDAYGDAGGGVKNLVVFHQKNCQLCKTTQTKKIVLAQRGTYYCPKCQK